MHEQIPLNESDLADVTKLDDGTLRILPDLTYKHLVMVNVAFLGMPGAGDRRWALFDAGLPGSAGVIKRAAARHFGEGARPAAIFLTHGHFDHVGALATLADEWDAPVFVHQLEFPFLTGEQSYAPPDPLIGGVMALSSVLYPRGPIDVRPHLHPLPDDGSIPFLSGWKWLPTPGHSPGHVSYWRESDGLLIAGDAIITMRQEDAYRVAVQEPEMHGPPMYFTPDWADAKESVARLAQLNPKTILCGHGRPMRGEHMRTALHELSSRFDEVAVPKNGRYTPPELRPEK